MNSGLKRLGFFGIVFVILIVAIFLIFLVVEQIKNRILVSLILAFVLALVITIFKSPFQNELSKELKTVIRYTMLCKDCGWEWMSNTTSLKPNRCPNCRSENLETLGWRKIKTNLKKEKDLRSFFK
ncbi:MAG: hypothetical protein PHE43_00340 [Candidatus Nanoarchaeia archaeon]|nr:hypothetical protein [Candidatus Nanoarchaeia archaeon]